MLWLLLVYAPICHWVWGGGWLASLGVMDFAGGIVVHATAGVSALVFALVLGGRHGFPHEIALPRNPGMTMVGAGDAVGRLVRLQRRQRPWPPTAMPAWRSRSRTVGRGGQALAWLGVGMGAASRRPSLVGTVTGAIAGLATITPAAGFIGPAGALPIGIAGGADLLFAAAAIKRRYRIDDTLDVFAVHGVGGMLGSLLTAVFAAKSLGGAGFATDVSTGGQLALQLLGVGVAAVWSGVLSFVILKAVAAAIGLRVPQDQEAEGLDVTAHGERAAICRGPGLGDRGHEVHHRNRQAVQA